ncbi:MAG: hypothetical protein ACN6OP_28765 [Pseudomonadales bacterium]
MTTAPTPHLRALAEAAEGNGEHIYTHPRDSNKWRENEAWHRAASPGAVLALLDRIAELEALKPLPLSGQEKVEWAWKYALEEAAKVCDEKSDHMGKRAAEEDCDADDAISLRSTAWIVKNCATAIRAMKDKP